MTLMDLSPERLETKPTWVLRVLRAAGAGEDMAGGRMGVSGSLRCLGLLLVEDGLEAGDVLAEGAQLVGLLDLAGLLAQAELEQLILLTLDPALAPFPCQTLW